MDVLITGSTGMVGKSVLNECINDNRISKIYLINRVPVNLKSSKVYECILDDFLKMGELKNKINQCEASQWLILFFNSPIFKKSSKMNSEILELSKLTGTLLTK